MQDRRLRPAPGYGLLGGSGGTDEDHCAIIDWINVDYVAPASRTDGADHAATAARAIRKLEYHRQTGMQGP